LQQRTGATEALIDGVARRNCSPAAAAREILASWQVGG